MTYANDNESRSHRHGYGRRSREVYGRREDCPECSRNDAERKALYDSLPSGYREIIERQRANVPQSQRQYMEAK